MAYSTAEMQKAREVPIFLVCQAKGIDLVLEKENKGKFVLGEWRVKGTNGLIICDNYFYWFGSPLGNGILEGQEGNSSNTLTFCIDFLKMEFKEAMQFLLVLAGNSPAPSAIAYEKSEPQAREIIHPKKALNNRKIIDYLTNKRELNREIISDLIDKGLLYQEQSRNNCVFVCKDFNKGEITGYEVKGILNKKFQRNYGSALFCISKGTPKTLIVFESAIDLLSYYQFYHYDKRKKDNFLLCSMGGVSKSKIIRNFALDFKLKYGSCSIKIATDDDEAGNNFFDTFLDKNQDLEVARKKPIFIHDKLEINKPFKDWNELLKWYAKQAK